MKGLFFVVATGILLYFIVKSWQKIIESSFHHLQATLNAIPDLLFEVDIDGKYYDYHSPRTDLLAASPEAFIGKKISDILPPEVANICLLALKKADKDGYAQGYQIELSIDGHVKWFELSVASKVNVDSNIKHFIVLSRDITERKENEEKIIRLSRLYATLSQCNQSIARSKSEDELFPLICKNVVDFGGIKMAWIGIKDESADYIKAVSFYGSGSEYLKNLFISLNPNDSTAKGPIGRAFHEQISFWCQDFQNDLMTKNWHEKGKEFGWASSAALPLKQNGKVIGVFTIYSSELNAFDNDVQNLLEEMILDINYALDVFANEKERRITEKRIHYLANFDTLTALPNRTQLDFLMKEIFNFAKLNSSNFVVMFLDLDRFKYINDSLGHSIGDTVLIETAARLKSNLRDEDTVARLGGDEFIIILPNIQINSIVHMAQRLLDGFQKPFYINNHELSISASIGISIYPHDGSDFETLYKNADTAMFRAKQDGRNTFCFFTREMQQYSMRHLELSNALRYALNRNELQLYYQPQISAHNGKLIGTEALLRWFHPTFGNVSPAEFIPIAEENGMILPIGEWVLRTAIAQAKYWVDSGHEPIIMAVNLSAVQFRSANLSSLISNILEEIGFRKEYLELELTESTTMQDPHKAINVMNDLHERGIKMSIDDFGTGYSSLSYLKKFNIYKLKIDQSFVRDINIDPEDKAIVGAIINMAKSLGLKTIAEGVETKSQLEYLCSEGCDEIQGYYYSKPLPLNEFEDFRHKIDTL
jgi:diguanylate cyclase (GGDEF)-like protein/PAS domain S-box-containing protein